MLIVRYRGTERMKSPYIQGKWVKRVLEKNRNDTKELLFIEKDAKMEKQGRERLAKFSNASAHTWKCPFQSPWSSSKILIFQGSAQELFPPWKHSLNHILNFPKHVYITHIFIKAVIAYNFYCFTICLQLGCD